MTVSLSIGDIPICGIVGSVKGEATTMTISTR